MSKTIRRVMLWAVAAVALVAAIVSYVHMKDLAETAGEGWRAWLIPLAVDGMMVVASMVMLIRRKTHKPAGWLPWTALSAGLLASLAANVAASQPTLIGHLVAAWPPVALALSYELLMEQIRTTAKRPTARKTPVRRKPAVRKRTPKVENLTEAA